MLENVVCLELGCQGHAVCIGKTFNGEIDFIDFKQSDKLYIQTIKEMKSEKPEKRDHDRFLEINFSLQQLLP